VESVPSARNCTTTTANDAYFTTTLCDIGLHLSKMLLDGSKEILGLNLLQ
jgi:hypothetical protein